LADDGFVLKAIDGTPVVDIKPVLLGVASLTRTGSARLGATFKT
jgi:tRNA (Thr-GGU) A37 N-methylase